MRKIEPLKPEELQKLMSMGIVSIRPAETVSLSTLRNRAWREANPEASKKNREKQRAYMRGYYARKKAEAAANANSVA